MIKTAFKIAIRFILYKTKGILSFVRKTFILAVISLSISIFSLIVLNSVKNGYKDSLGAKLLSIESDIEIVGNDIPKKEILDLINAMGTLDIDQKSLPIKIQEVQVLQREEGVIRFGSNAEGVNVVSLEGQYDNIYKQFYSLENLQSPLNNEVILGELLKEKLDINIGDKLHLFKLNDFISSSFKKVSEPLIVKGFFKMGNPFEDSHTIIISNNTFFNFYQDKKIKNIKISLEDPTRREEVRKLIYDKIDAPLYINIFNEKFHSMSSGLDQVFDVISIIVLFFILLSILNIISSVSLITESKSMQIKLLRLSGANSVHVSLIFIFISLISIISSFFVGYVLSEIVIFIQNHYNIISISEDVYVISELKGLIDYHYIFLFLVYLIISGFLLSIIFSYKTIYKKVKI